ncbi:MAG: ABC transporter ATP-binding protein [Planctomycetota bacterium]|nr:ABC transporter ATP-binding protein [Planctomycetota bacterium]MDA1114558.1 ABC transporter ATP-binding protein [Planctomycetota bacterium]
MDKAGAAFDKGLVKRLWVFVAPHQKWLWKGLGLLMLVSACRLTMPWLIKLAIDQHLSIGDLSGYYPLLMAFAVVASIDALLRRSQQLAVETGGQNALLDLRLALFRHLQELPAAYFDRTPTGRLIGRVTTDVEALQELFSSGVVTILGDLIFLIATLVILFSLHFKLALVAILVVPVLLALTMLIRLRVRTAYVSMRAKLSEMNGFLHERLSGMSVVQMFSREEETMVSYAEINHDVRGAQLKTVWWETCLSTTVELLSSFTVAIILWYGGGLVAENWQQGGIRGGLTLGVLFAFIDYMQKFFQPLNELSLKYTVMQNAMTAARRIFDLLDEAERLPETENPQNPGEVVGEIRFEKVTFGYDPKNPVLKNVSFSVAPGEKVALVGATGAGKTTVLKLLTRLYDPSHGRITLDGIDLRDYEVRDLRKRIGLVPQDVFLFEGDILENIRLGNVEVSEEKAIAAATRLHLDQLVNRFPGGWHEPVRERGRNLSAGEKQLISFARVLAASPRVLVLDEATSNVDSHTEHILQEAVHDIMQGRTSLAIAHRLSTVRDADRILVFHQGELAEQGTHDQLIAEGGLYACLVVLQYSET